MLLLHSALGPRPAVDEFADRLRTAGHEVRTPDYFDGHTFDTAEAGIAYTREVGFGTLFRRIGGIAEELPADAVLAGFSLGAFFAQRLAEKRPQARAAILLHSADAAEGPWPTTVPVQVHRYESDPWIDLDNLARLRASVTTAGARFEDLVVPGTGHLFTEVDGPDGDAAATEAAATQILDLIGR